MCNCLHDSIYLNFTVSVAGHFNGHVGQHSKCFSQYHGGYGYEILNQEGRRILDI